MTSLLTIGQAAAASGLSPDTIRFYEREGVLPRVPRGTNSYRGYPPEHVETLARMVASSFSTDGRSVGSELLVIRRSRPEWSCKTQ